MPHKNIIFYVLNRVANMVAQTSKSAKLFFVSFIVSIKKIGLSYTLKSSLTYRAYPLEYNIIHLKYKQHCLLSLLDKFSEALLLEGFEGCHHLI